MARLPPSIVGVTGASGFAGSCLVKRLVELGHHVIGLDTQAPFSPVPGVDYRIVDFCDRTELASALRGVEFDFGVHLYERTGVWGAAEDYDYANVRGTQVALDLFLQSGAKRVVHLSSVLVSDPTGLNLSGDAPTQPFGDVYSVTKARAEDYARTLQSRGAPVTILRAGYLYGIGAEQWVERPVALLRAQRLVLVERGFTHFPHLHIQNMVHAILLALASPRASGNTYVVTDQCVDTSFRDYFIRLAEAVRAPHPVMTVSGQSAMVFATLCEWAARIFGMEPLVTQATVRTLLRSATYDTSATVRDLGYHPQVSFEDGIRELAAHYRSLL